MSDGRPVELFLGAAAAAGGPFALLGLAPEDCTQELIIVQLQRQLKRVAAHEEGGSPAADEVRLALHAAAARLLEGLASGAEGMRREEPEVREAAGGLAGGVEARDSGEARREGLTSGMIAMERDILATVAQFGGWNSQSLHRLAMIAHSRGVTQEEFLGAVGALQRGVVPSGGGVGMGVGAGAEGAGHGTRKAAPARKLDWAAKEELAAARVGHLPVQPDEADPTMRVITAGAIVIVVILALLGGAIYVVAKLTSGGGTGSGPTAVVTPGEGDGGIDANGVSATTPMREPVRQLFPKGEGDGKSGDTGGSGDSRRPEVVGETRDVASLIRDLRASIELARAEPGAALEKFRSGVQGAQVLWTRATPDQIVALQDAVVEFVYRIGGKTDEGRAAVEACVDGVRSLPSGRLSGADVRGAIFSAGLVVRLSRERELPSETVDMLAGLLRGGFFRTLSIGEMSFKGGAMSACVEMGRRLVPRATDPLGGEKESAEAWVAWVECVGALGLEARMRDRLVLQAMDELVRQAPEPNRFRTTFDAIGITASALAWGAGEESRGRLLRWFEDPEVTVADLYAVTTAVTGKGLSIGLDSGMILSAVASESARSNLKERYQEVWGTEDFAARSRASERLVEVAQVALAEAVIEGVEGRLSTALWFSRLSETAETVWAGKASSSLAEKREVTPGTSPGGPPLGALSLTTTGAVGSETWAVQYLALRLRIAERIGMLTAYAPGGTETLRMEAGVIVEESVRGSPIEVRRAAAKVVREHADNPAFVEAMLNEAATMPLTRENAALAARVSRGGLLSVRNPGFRVSMRRALVERLLELLSGEGEYKRVDAIGDRMAESYQTRAKVSMDALGREGGMRTDDVVEGEEEEGQVVGAVAPLERSSRMLRIAFEEQAKRALPTGKEVATLEEIRTVRGARSRAAQGRLQRFVADQAALVDLLGYLVVTESGTRATAVKGVLDAYGESRRGAKHVTEQIEAGERAMLELWVLRMKGEGA